MKKHNSTQILSFILLFIAASIPATTAHSANLFIDPASPLVQMGGQINLCVNNPSGEVKWSAFEGEIEKTGNSVKYKAPDRVAIDAVTAKDSAGNVGTVTVVVQEKEKIDERFSIENANCEIFTSRRNVFYILLSEDSSTLWVGTFGGLEKRNAATGQLIQVFTTLDGLGSNTISTLLSDTSTGLWIGTLTGGLTRLKHDVSWEVFNQKNSGLPYDVVSSLLSNGSGGLWIGTHGGGVAHLKHDGSWEVFNQKNSGLPVNEVRSLLLDGSGGLWIGTDGGGVAHLKHDGSWEVFNQKNSGLPVNEVRPLLLDGSGGLWIGTVQSGLAHKKNDGSWEMFNEENSGLPYNSVFSLLSDGSGGLWIGTDGGGVAHLKHDGSWEVFNTDNSMLPSNCIGNILLENNGGLWIGTHNGLAHLKSDGTWNVPDNDKPGLPDISVKAILSDGSGGLWIGTEYGGLAHKKTYETWEQITPLNSKLPSYYVKSLLSDGSGGIWIGTSQGLALLKSDGRGYVIKTDNSQLPDNDVKIMSSDGSGGIWIGTNSGLARLKSDGKWENYLPDQDIQAILVTNTELFVGTAGSGLAYFKSGGTWQVFNTTNSILPDNNIKALLLNGKGSLWVGTAGGLALLNSDGTGNASNAKFPCNSILSDGLGGIWVGVNAIPQLLHYKSDGMVDVFSPTNSKIPPNGINTIVSDGQNGLWLGMEIGGLAHLTYSSSQIQDEQYLKNGRAAIIIAGGGNTSDNALWDSTAKISNYAYKMLNKRGFLNTDIHYISPQSWADFNGDGIDDKIVDAPNPARQIQVADIQAAFDWAKTKGTLNQPLYIFFTDHGGDSKLQLAKGVYIEASELKTMLDDYQKTTGNKVVVIIDACHSGTMVKALAGENRAIISSTGDGAAYFDRLNGQSFTWYVTKGLDKGMNFNEAFYYASSEYKKALGKVSQYESISAGSDTLNLTQEPQFDDNGDGLYNISVDGNWLKTVSVNGTWSNADVTLTVEAVTQSSTILNSNTQTILKAKATLAKGRVNRVWAVIRPPKMDILFDSTTGTPILAFPKVDLSSSTTEGEENIYQGSWNGFVYNGEYEITFYAEDNDKNIESSESIVLTVADGLACPEKGSLKVGVDKQPDSTGKITYKSGDKLKISVTENLAYGYDLYVALLMPDGNFTALKNPMTDFNINYLLQKENFNKFYWGDRWIDTNRNINMGKAVDVVDLTLPQEKLPQGQYFVYAALIPEGQDLMLSSEKGFIVPERFGGVCFEVEL